MRSALRMSASTGRCEVAERAPHERRGAERAGARRAPARASQLRRVTRGAGRGQAPASPTLGTGAACSSTTLSVASVSGVTAPGMFSTSVRTGALACERQRAGRRRCGALPAEQRLPGARREGEGGHRGVVHEGLQPAHHAARVLRRAPRPRPSRRRARRRCGRARPSSGSTRSRAACSASAPSARVSAV